ncbi:hypothetical protein ACFX2H_025164 [Malus domestica]
MEESVHLDQVSEKPIPKIFQEREPSKKKSAKMPGKPGELKEKDCPFMSTNEEEEEESLLMIRREWIKIGDEYFENPVAITPAPQVITVIAMDSSFHSGRNKPRKSKFEAEDQGNAPFLTARSVPANLQTEIPENAFIKNLSHNMKEKHVQLHVINRHFLSPTDEMEPEEELASPFSFRTKRRNMISESSVMYLTHRRMPY